MRDLDAGRRPTGIDVGHDPTEAVEGDLSCVAWESVHVRLRRAVLEHIDLYRSGRFGPVDRLKDLPAAGARRRIEEEPCQRVAMHRGRLGLLHTIEDGLRGVADLR